MAEFMQGHSFVTVHMVKVCGHTRMAVAMKGSGYRIEFMARVNNSNLKMARPTKACLAKVKEMGLEYLQTQKAKSSQEGYGQMINLSSHGVDEQTFMQQYEFNP